MASPRLRVGIVDFLNSRPLAWGFLRGDFSESVAASYHVPSRVADRLAEGSLDVGLIPSIEAVRIPGLKVVPGTCVAATREVRSVLLLSRVPIEKVRRVELDRNSRTSAALVQILLAEQWGVRPELEVRAVGRAGVEDGFDAALLIGDPALRVDRSGLHVLDLAASWRALTGLPFVFAVWAAREEVDTAGLEAIFETSLASGRRDLSRMVRDAAAELGLAESVVRRYLTENLRFELGAEEIDGLREFYRRARAHGLLDPDIALPALDLVST